MINIDSGPPTPNDSSVHATAERGGGGRKRAGEEVEGVDSKVRCHSEKTTQGRRQTQDVVDGDLAVADPTGKRTAQNIPGFCFVLFICLLLRVCGYCGTALLVILW